MLQRTPDLGTAFIEATHGTNTSYPLPRHRTHDPNEDLRRSSRHKRRTEKASATFGSANSTAHEKEVHHAQNGGMRPKQDGNVRKLPNTFVQPTKPPIFRQSTASKLTTAMYGQQSLTNIQVVSQIATAIANEGHQLNLRKPDLSNKISSNQEGTKVTKLFPEMQQLKEQLPQRAVGATLPEVRPSRSRHGRPELQLPNQSPLHNMITFAKVEEDIIQAKLQCSLAEKAVRREYQLQGRVSAETTWWLKQAGTLLKGRSPFLMRSDTSANH